LSFVLQKLAHNGNKEKVSYTRLPFWWLGILFLILGEVGEFIAYGLAPVSLISPLGTVTGLKDAFPFLIEKITENLHIFPQLFRMHCSPG
jgi:hypothetical protein